MPMHETLYAGILPDERMGTDFIAISHAVNKENSKQFHRPE